MANETKENRVKGERGRQVECTPLDGLSENSLTLNAARVWKKHFVEGLNDSHVLEITSDVLESKIM